MAFPSITAFKQNLLDGGARPSLFQMEISWPAAIPAIGGAERLAPFHCRVSEIPGTLNNPIVVKYAGREVKYAGQRVFNNLTVTILNDEGFTVRKAIESWMEGINTTESNVAIASAPVFNGYGGVGKVTQYKKVGTNQAGADKARSYVFIDMFPVNLAAIPLDWSNDAAIEEYTVEFAYQYWVPGEAYAGPGQFAL